MSAHGDIAVLAILGAMQEPLPPEVKLPVGWTVSYGIRTKYGQGAIIGPGGQQIGFPSYTPTGAVAAVLSEMYGGTLYLRAMIDGLLVEVGVSPKGMIAVSYPPVDGGLPGYPFSSGRVFDYWSEPKNARQVAKALSIPLTRLEAQGVTAGSASAMKWFSPPTAAYPFAHLVVHGYGYRSEARFAAYHGKDMVQPGQGAPTKTKWVDKTSLLGRELQIAEDDKGRIWVTITRGTEARVVFIASGNRAQETAVAVLAALTYKATPGTENARNTASATPCSWATAAAPTPSPISRSRTPPPPSSTRPAPARSARTRNPLSTFRMLVPASGEGAGGGVQPARHPHRGRREHDRERVL